MGACQEVAMCRENSNCCAGDNNLSCSNPTSREANTLTLKAENSVMSNQPDYKRSECIKWLQERIQLEVDMQKFSIASRETERRNSKMTGKSLV